MFDPDELPRLKAVIRERTLSDRKLFEELMEDIRRLKSNVRMIKPRTTTAVSLVASDGGNNKLEFDPFYIQLVRVVDSYGKQLCLDAVSPTFDLEALDRAQFHKDGTPRTALGRVIEDLGVPDRSLSGLCHMMPDPKKLKGNPGRVSPGWVRSYRDLCEWAALYERICYRNFATDTLIVRDGLLRSPLFREPYFLEFTHKIEAGIEKIYREDRRKVYLIGLAKQSKVLTRYNLAMSVERLFRSGAACFVPVPREIEAKAYIWPDYPKGAEGKLQDGDAAKFVAGDMFFVRFGQMEGDPVWCTDILSSQKGKAQEIFGYLLADAMDGFPIPYYPRCLQKAHEYAQIADFDIDLLQGAVLDAVRELLPEKRKSALEEMALKTDSAKRRYP